MNWIFCHVLLSDENKGLNSKEKGFEPITTMLKIVILPLNYSFKSVWTKIIYLKKYYLSLEILDTVCHAEISKNKQYTCQKLYMYLRQKNVKK